jgi:Tfp pilus assembly protein PilX
MKILKMRNGIALMAVLVIMFLTSLFIPVMFNLSNTSVRIAVKGTDRQQAW